MPEVDLFLDARADLGEGPVWHGERRILNWVDINAGVVHETDEAGADRCVEAFETSVGFVDWHGDHLVIGRSNDVIVQDASSSWTVWGAVKTGPSQRINDGAVAPDGSVVFGTLNESSDDPTNALYRIEEAGQPEIVRERVRLSNGIGWSRDGSRILHIDTPTRRVDVATWPLTDDAINRWSLFCDLAGVRGVPDGLCVDADDHLWVAMWGGSQIVRISPAGELVDAVDLPALNPTSCAVGPDGCLFVTSARKESPGRPEDGAIFKVTF